MFSNYLKATGLTLLLFAIPLGCNWLFLFNVGELMPFTEIVDRQLNASEYCIVGLATHHAGYHYKKAMYQHIQPDILLLGSSRTLPFNHALFTAPMLTVGGAMSSLDEGYALVQELFVHSTPKIVLFGLDYWWFNTYERTPNAYKKPSPQAHQLSLRSYFLPFLWLWQKKISLFDYFSRLHPRYLIQRDFAQGIGVDGIVNRTGYAPDGAYFYTKTIIGKEKSSDEQFQHSLMHAQQLNPFYHPTINDVHFETFLKIIQHIQAQGSRVILFIPPVAPTLAKAIDTSYHNIAHSIHDLRRRLQAAGLRVYDFHDGSAWGTDCEFVDGTHGGGVFYAKMLAHMAQHETQLAPFVNMPYLEHVRAFSGLAMVPQKPLTDAPEVDFLKIACHK